MAVEPRGVGVEVVGVPNFMPNDRIVDKLLIHFLRPRNGGGEVRHVIYPTHLPGQALVIYEDPDVASRVLQRRHHELEVGERRFSLEVKPADRPELDLPVEATLNTSMIADKRALKRLIRLHNFEVIDKRTDEVRLRGSIMMLRSLKAEIEKLMNAQTPNLTRPTSSSSSSGQSSQSPPVAVSKNSTQAKQKPLTSIDPPAYDSRSWTPTSPSSSSSWSPIGPEDNNHPPSRKLPEESFMASSDVVDYAQRYKNDDIADILASCNVEMHVVAMDAELSSVVVTGWDAHPAAGKLQRFLNDLCTTIHARMVPLDNLDHDAQVDMAKRIQELRHSSPSVLIRQTGKVIHLIGPRSACDTLKERLLLERPVEPPAGVRMGRSQERSQEAKRRNRSVPTKASSARIRELTDEAKPAPLASLDSSYSSLRLDGERAQSTAEVRGRRARPSSLTRVTAKPEKTEASYGSAEGTNLKPTASPVKSFMPKIKAMLNPGTKSTKR